MTTATVQNITVNVNQLDRAVRNLHVRWYYYHTDGQNLRQFQKLRAAYSALYNLDMDLAEQAWDAAYRDVCQQMSDRGKPAPDYIACDENPFLPKPKAVDPQKALRIQPTVYIQEDYIDTVNDVTAATLEFSNPNTAEREYDGYSFQQLQDLDLDNMDGLYTRTFDEHVAWVETLLDRTYNGILDPSKNIWYRALMKLSVLTSLMDKMIPPIPNEQKAQIDNRMNQHLDKVVNQGESFDDEFYSLSFKAMRGRQALRREALTDSTGVKDTWRISSRKPEREIRKNAKRTSARYNPTFTVFVNHHFRREGKHTHRDFSVEVLTNEKAKRYRKMLKSAQSLYYNESQMIPERSGRIELLSDSMSQLMDQPKHRITEDLTRGIRHNGFRLNRTATYGIGSAKGVQPYHQMHMEYFYALLRTREVTIANNRYEVVKYGKDDVDVIVHTSYKPAIPRWDIADIMSPTEYTGGKHVANHNIDQFIRALCLAQWHDEAHGTSYFTVASNLLIDKYPFAPDVIQVAMEAYEMHPQKGDDVRRRRFEKEWKVLQDRRWGPFHWTAINA